METSRGCLCAEIKFLADCLFDFLVVYDIIIGSKE